MTDDVAEEAIRAALGEAELIYQKIDDDRPADFYLVDGIVLVVVSETVVTLFRAEYGFDPEIDRRICQELRTALTAARERLAQAKDAANKNALATEDELTKINWERRRIEARLQELQARENKILNHQAELDRIVEGYKYEVESYAQKLVYSVLYRSEWTSGKVKQLG